MNVKAYNQDQALLFPPEVRQLLPDDHLAVIINDIVDSMDLSLLYRKVPAEGNPSYHPAMMLKVLVYAYASGVFSSRKIQKALQESVAFIFLAAWQRPDFRTISDFRKNHLAELKILFGQVVGYAEQMKMLSLGHVAIDGSKFRANASDRHTWTEKRIDKKIEKLLATSVRVDAEEDAQFGSLCSGDEVPDPIRRRADRIQELKKIRQKIEAAGKGSLSLTDKDAVFMKTAHGIRTCYNAQVAVEEKSQVIVAAEVVNDPNDVAQLVPMIEQVEAGVGQPEKVSADSGYSSGENLKAVAQKGIDAYIPDPELQGRQRRPPKEKYFHRSRFIRQEAEDCFICPAGQKLSFFRLQKDTHGSMLRVYLCHGSATCPLKPKCTKAGRGRTISISAHAKELQAMRDKLETESGKRIYQRRQAIVEPVFATLKRAIGFAGFLLRGLPKVRGEFALLCLAHNLRKIAGYVRNERICPQTA